MKPRSLLFFLFACMSSFVLLGLAFPEGIPIGDFNLRLYQMAGPGLKEEHAPVEKKVDKTELLKLQEKTEILAAAGSSMSEIPDEPVVEDMESIEAEFHIDSSSALQFPAGDSTILRGFFLSLDSARKKGELIRILHIGDSQIEGDRISGYLRQRLQQRFGGCGPGFIPFAEPEPSRLYLRMSGFENTEKFQLLGKGKKGFHNRYSLFHSFFRLKNDSLRSFLHGNFSYRLNKQGYRRNSYFEQATLLTRNHDSQLRLQEGSSSKSWQPSDSLRFSRWTFPKTASELSLKISSGPTTDFLGICLDCRAGVALDNIPLRGSSGLELLRIKPSFLQEQIRRLNTRLIILQFGVNVVPYEAPSYSWYENTLVKIIQTLKKSAPGIQVLVIGVSDMARKKNGIWNSFETIPRVIQAQKRACARTNSAFWDMYHVMGGKNAILAWSKTNPPLAGKDMIHLTPKGAQVAGEFLFQAIQNQMGHVQHTGN